MARARSKTSATPVRARKPARAKVTAKTKAKVKPKTGTRARPRRGASQSRMIESALAALAHEIRTPLTGILALAELLSASELGGRERAWAQSIKQAAEHLAQLTTIVTDAVRAGDRGLALRDDIFSPRLFAESAALSLSARAQTAGLSSETVVAENVPEYVRGDAVRLRAALENLIDNAVKFTAQGSVRLAISSKRLPEKKIALVFTVSDTGIGLTATEIKKLFRPFSQANEAVSRRYGGAGLGLMLVRRLARAMDGDLTVTSKAEAGSTFVLTVVVDAVRQAVRKTNGATRTQPIKPPLKILSVEDNPYGRVILNTVLHELGHQADFVGSGEAAVEAVARGGYDLVLMDITLSGIDGMETTRRIRKLGGRKGGTPVIAISARSTPADEASARAAGMKGYLVKPVSPQVLADMLDKVRR